MEKDELNSFLQLLKARNKSFSELKKMQTEISNNISDATQGQMNRLSSGTAQLFDELENQCREKLRRRNLLR